MARKFRDPEAPEVLQAVLERFENMTREEWLAKLARRPEGARETWRTARTRNGASPPGAANSGKKRASATAPTLDSSSR